MDIITAIVLGIVQGLTEFLPVSSSGHLVLLRKIFGINAPGLFFDIMLHVGTLSAVFVVLWKDIWKILNRIIQPLTGFLIIATIPAVIAALAFNDLIESAFESGQFLGICFLITSALLITAEQLAKRAVDKKNGKNMSWLDAVLIGIFQALAIAPGISRSGATISGALCRKLDRDFAARFSFMLSIPAILGALVLQVKDLAKVEAEMTSENIGALAVVAGTVTAAAVGFFAVKLMLKIIKEKSLYGFAVYTASVGILVLIDQFVTRIVF
ncbi:MAG: undecaprenyl-diphosphate phosphatase [Treponema sp.]|jgi:undecaprenyl-diphosphatase|nr:undecaprenyl-diphosphate phosphatase [Treponema sp.]